MARTGRFGREPRSAPSLTNTVIAIAREFQQQRDTNIMNAWEKGGMFEGKKATDKLVLAHWRERVAGVSVDDPLHDTYQNAVTQLDYTINESKMTAKYALSHKTPADDKKMVAFYLGWAKKVPKDSEFYRVLQRDAGQYIRTVTNNHKASDAAAKEKAYNDAQAATDHQYGAAAAFLTDTMRRLNQSGYAAGHLSATLDAPGSGGRSDLLDFNPADPEEAMKLLALIAPHHEGRALPGDIAGSTPTGKTGEFANKSVLYHSDTIDPKTKQPKPITGADIMAKLEGLDPSYKVGQPVDVAYLTGLLNRQNMGLQMQIDRATKTGHMTDAEQLTKQKSYIATLSRVVSSMPVEKAYLDIEDTFDSVSNDPTASPMAVEKARAMKDAALAGLLGDKRIASNDNMKSRIQAEIDGNSTQPTLRDSFTGNGTGQESQHAKFLMGQREQNMKDIEEVNRDAIKLDTDPTKLVWTHGSTNRQTGVFVPDPNGVEVGKSDMATITGSGAMPQTVTVPDPRGGVGIKMVVTAVPVYGKAFDPVTHKEIPPQNNQPIAWAYNFPNGGKANIQYGYLVKDPTDPGKSVMHYSDAEHPPWSDKLQATPSSSGGNHFEVDFSGLLPASASTSGAPGSQQLAVDLTKPGAVSATGPDGKPISGFNVDDVGKPTLANPKPTGTLTWDPYAIARNSDVGRVALGGTDPVTDFTSLTVSNLMSHSDGQVIMKTLDQNGEFRSQITNDGMAYAGATQMPDGTWDTTRADVGKLAQAEAQQNLMKGAASVVDVISKAGLSWQRMTTGSPYPGNTPPNGTQPNFLNNPVGTVSKLATDLVKGTPFEPIAQAFMGGTLTKKPPTFDDSKKSLMIDVGKAIKVPGYEAKSVTTNQTNIHTTGVQGGNTSGVNPMTQPKTPPQQPQQSPGQSPGYANGPKAL